MAATGMNPEDRWKDNFRNSGECGWGRRPREGHSLHPKRVGQLPSRGLRPQPHSPTIPASYQPTCPERARAVRSRTTPSVAIFERAISQIRVARVALAGDHLEEVFDLPLVRRRDLAQAVVGLLAVAVVD